MLEQVIRSKRFFTWWGLLRTIRGFKRARKPIRGYVTTVTWWALMDCGLIEALERQGRVSLGELAAGAGLNQEVLTYLCRYLDRTGHLRMEGDQVSFTRKGRSLQEAARGVLHIFQGYEPIFSSLTALLRNEARFGTTVQRRESVLAQGIAELGPLVIFRILGIILRRQRLTRVIDLGCGDGSFGEYLSPRLPEMTYLGVDHDRGAIARARDRFARAGLQDRFQAVQGDIFHLAGVEADLAPYSVATAIDLFHGYRDAGDQRLVALFRQLREVLAGKKVLFSEICLPSRPRMRKIAYPYAEHELFHDLTGQKSFDRGELEAALEKAGYRLLDSWIFNDMAGRQFLLAE